MFTAVDRERSRSLAIEGRSTSAGHTRVFAGLSGSERVVKVSCTTGTGDPSGLKKSVTLKLMASTTSFMRRPKRLADNLQRDFGGGDIALSGVNINPSSVL